MRSSHRLSVFFFALALATSGCADFDRGSASDGEDGGGTPPPGGSVGYALDVHPLLVQRCTACHGASSSRPFKLTGDPDPDYPVTLEFVNLDNPSSSLLLTKGTGTTGHGGGSVLNAQDAALIEGWIVDGAPP